VIVKLTESPATTESVRDILVVPILLSIELKFILTVYALMQW